MYVLHRLPTSTVFIFPSLRQIIFASHIVNSRDLNIKTNGIELLFSFSFFFGDRKQVVYVNGFLRKCPYLHPNCKCQQQTILTFCFFVSPCFQFSIFPSGERIV